MVTKVKIPRTSANVEEVTVTGWFKKEGEQIEKGEPLLEITTAKTCIEIEARRSGVVRRILAKTKSVLPVGYTVALMGGIKDALPDVSEENRKLLETLQNKTGRKKTPRAVKGKKPKDRVRATPSARRLAKELGLDLSALQKKTGAEIVTRNMVEKAINEK